MKASEVKPFIRNRLATINVYDITFDKPGFELVIKFRHANRSGSLAMSDFVVEEFVKANGFEGLAIYVIQWITQEVFRSILVPDRKFDPPKSDTFRFEVIEEIGEREKRKDAFAMMPEVVDLLGKKRSDET